MSDIKKNIKIEISSEKNFGITFSIIFFLISTYCYFNKSHFIYLFLFLSLLFLLTSLIHPSILKIPNFIWFKFGNFLGHIISFFIMFIIFFSIGSLTSLFLKITKKDPLNRNFKKNMETYWLKREKQTSLKNQF